MYGTSSESGEDSDVPPTCPACQGKTYYVDPEQTVITCYDCGRYFRRKKPGTDDAPGLSTPPPVAPPPMQEPPSVEPQVPEPPVVPEPPAPKPAAIAEPPIPEPPAYAPPPPPVYQSEDPSPPVAEPEYAPPEVDTPMSAQEVVAEEGDFDLMLGDAAEVPEAEHPPHASVVVGETVHCSICGFPMMEDWKVCPNCVSRYETSCANCGKTMSAWWLICPWCETPKHEDHIHFGKS
jgi:hypothetical protein